MNLWSTTLGAIGALFWVTWHLLYGRITLGSMLFPLIWFLFMSYNNDVLSHKIKKLEEKVKE